MDVIVEPQTPLTRAAVAFAAAASINSASVAGQRCWKLHERIAGDKAWWLHLGLITPAWLSFLVLLRALDRSRTLPMPRSRGLGLAGLVAATALWISAAQQLGPATVANGNFFGRGGASPARLGPYRWLRDPMYDSYALGLLSWAFYRGNAAFIALAAESIVLLNLVESRTERLTTGG